MAITTNTPRLMTQKKRNFIEAYLECGNGAEAARRAGYSEKDAKGAAYRLLNNDQPVMEAIEARRAAVRDRTDFTMDTLMAEFDEGRKLADKTGNASALVRASEMKGKASGLILDRASSRSGGYALHGDEPDFEGMTDDELKAYDDRCAIRMAEMIGTLKMREQLEMVEQHLRSIGKGELIGRDIADIIAEISAGRSAKMIEDATEGRLGNGPLQDE